MTAKETTPQPPAVVPETPKQPRSILKQNDFNQKKRRVVFAGSDEQHLSSSEEDDKVLNLTKVFLFFFHFIFIFTKYVQSTHEL